MNTNGSRDTRARRASHARAHGPSLAFAPARSRAWLVDYPASELQPQE